MREVGLLEIGLPQIWSRMAAQIVPDHVKSHGLRDKTRPAGVPNPPKVISSIQKAISVGSASPLFSVGTLFLRGTFLPSNQSAKQPVSGAFSAALAPKCDLYSH
jgi:hypothetical protein